MALDFHHVDVFAPRPYSGNSVAVFPEADRLTAEQMAAITREMRHFESVFLTADRGRQEWVTRVFDLGGELSFAGHPVLGAAAVLHAGVGSAHDQHWTLRLPARTVELVTKRRGPSTYAAVLDQGTPEFLGTAAMAAADLAAWFGLGTADLDPAYEPEVVSTGLKYLLLPVHREALSRARIVVADLADRLSALGAEFAYLLDVGAMEGRHWNNDGVVEDVATGSAAGCVAAYLRRHDVLADGAPAVLRQGRFVDRPSEMTISAHGDAADIRSVEVGGDVTMVGRGHLDVLPA
jgi:PhzF family phenazine biosynthesis protein